MRLVPTSMLQPDMVLARAVYCRGCLVLREGQNDLGRFASRLHNMGIKFLYVEDSKSEGIAVPDAVSGETRAKCKEALRLTLERLEKDSVVEVEQLEDVIQSILDEILENKEVQISLNDISATDDYTFSHSVGATVYSLLLAKKLNYSRSMMEKLAIGTLLHDVGKVLLDKKIMFKEEELTADEYEYVKQHALLGYQALKKCTTITELSRIVALVHHERMDGLGYPRGVKAGQLHEFARIVAIADVYDALTTDRCYRERWSNEDAVNHLIEHSGTKFDADLVALFIKQIAIYPNGSLVRLSSGHYGIVKEQNKSLPLRPIVRVIADSNRKEVEMYEIDLLKELSVTIVGSEVELNHRTTKFEIDK